MPSESNFDHAAVSQEGGCQLNHLYGGVIHPWSVPTQQKINPEACTCQLPCHLPLGIQQRRSTAISTAFSCCIPVYSALSSSRAACRGIQLYSGIQRSTVYSSTAVYSIQRYTFPVWGVPAPFCFHSARIIYIYGRRPSLRHGPLAEVYSSTAVYSRSTVYSSTAVYSIQRYTFPLRLKYKVRMHVLVRLHEPARCACARLTWSCEVCESRLYPSLPIPVCVVPCP